MANAVNDSRGAVEKALDVLAALVEPGGPHPLGEIAQRTGLTKPTVHRTLRTLTETGYAMTSSGGTYSPGPKLLSMAAAALHNTDSRDLAHPVLADLQRRTGHTVHYAVRNGNEAVYVDKVEAAQAYRMTSQIGGTIPLYCTGIGRAILSRLPEHEVTRVLTGEPLVARTPHTLTKPNAIRAALVEARQNGFAVDDEQNETDVRCVAAPVFDAREAVIGAISVSGLVFTLREDAISDVGALVREAAARITAALGGSTKHGEVDTA